MTLRVLVVDDEPVARRGIRRLLQRERDVEVVGECGDGAAAVAAIAELAPDLVLLDVQMPGASGFDVVDAVGLERMPAVVFVTAFDQHAVAAFDVHAVDYVLKPVDRERFALAIARVRTRLADPAARLDARIVAALTELGAATPQRWARRLSIRTSGRVVLIETGDISRVEAAGNCVEVHAAGKVRTLRDTLANVEARLDPARFARVSRSALVNLDFVVELQPLYDGDFVVVLRDGAKVPGSRRYREVMARAER